MRKKAKKIPLPVMIIGRFQPFHLGHLDMVKQILAMPGSNGKIIIGIGSAQHSNTVENPFSAALRAKIIKKSLIEAKIPTKKFILIKIPDINNDNKWVRHVEKLSPLFGGVCSGTPKVQKLFKKDGKHPVIKPKFNLKISGTIIRKKILEKDITWRKMVPRAVYVILAPVLRSAARRGECGDPKVINIILYRFPPSRE